MASIAKFSILVFLPWFYAVTEPKQTDASEVTINVNCRCHGIGLNNVSIIWKPIAETGISSEYMYKIYFCKQNHGRSCNYKPREYQFGCTLNATSPSQKELHCNVGPRLSLQFSREYSFYFVVKAINSSGVYTSRRKACRLTAHLKCTKPQKLRITTLSSRNVTLSWEPPPYMGRATDLLCYRIVYSAAGKTNKSVLHNNPESSLSETIQDLHSYTEYSFFIQCSLSDCLNGWGQLAGPVTNRTEEEAPSEPPVFDNWSQTAIDGVKRDVIVMWQLPPNDSWNGVPRKFEIDVWQLPTAENATSNPNASRSLKVDDGLATKATLAGLDRFSVYETRISMCTSKGCGPSSYPLRFQADEDSTLATAEDGRLKEEDSAIPYYVWIIVGALVVLAATVVMYVYCRRRKNPRERPEPLHTRIQFDEPHDYNDITDTTSGGTRSYDELQLHERNTDESPSPPLTPHHLQTNPNVVAVDVHLQESCLLPGDSDQRS